MSEAQDIIHPSLLPEAIRDERGEAFRKTLGNMLSTIDVTAHLMTDPYKVNVKLLPFLVVERSLQEYIFPGIREEHLRRLIDFSPEIHGLKGTVAGVRKAFEAFNLHVSWVQWFEETPKAPHDTHKVTVFFNETLVDENALNDEPNAENNHLAVRRIIGATKRWSQTVHVTFGYLVGVKIHLGAIAHIGGIIHHKNAPPEDQLINMNSHIGAAVRMAGRLTHRSAA